MMNGVSEIDTFMIESQLQDDNSDQELCDTHINSALPVLEVIEQSFDTSIQDNMLVEEKVDNNIKVATNTCSFETSISPSPVFNDVELDRDSSKFILNDELCSGLMTSQPIIDPIHEGCSNKSTSPSKDFIWEEYLEQIDSFAVPPTAFLHVESLREECKFKVGQIYDYVHTKTDSCNSKWPVRVVAVFDQLLLLQYLHTDHSFLYDSSSTTDLHQLSDVGKDLAPPPGITLSKQAPSFTSWPSLSVGQFNQAAPPPEIVQQSLPINLLYQNISSGEFVNVVDALNPYKSCCMKVEANCGGRLKLIHENQESCAKPLWLFCTSNRLRPFKCTEASNLSGPKVEDEEDNPIGCSNNNGTCPQSKHKLEVGIFLEAVHPITKDQINVAQISEIHDDIFFSISINDFTWITNIEDQTVLPAGFCQRNNLKLVAPDSDFKWSDFLAQKKAITIPDQGVPSKDVEFEENMYLEAVLPANEPDLCVAKVIKVIENLLWVTEAGPDNPIYILPCNSNEIFPAGFAQACGLHLITPDHVTTPPTESKNVPTFEAAIPPQIMGHIRWCPRVYINPLCNPGPFINYRKLTMLPKSYGSGRIELVRNVVVGGTIKAGQCPTRVLKLLRTYDAPDHWYPEQMKAKFRRNVVKAPILLPSSTQEMPVLFQKLADVLECCPNVWSFEPPNGVCPFNCISPEERKTDLNRLRKKGRRSKKNRRPIQEKPQSTSQIEEEDSVISGRSTPVSDCGSSSNHSIMDTLTEVTETLTGVTQDLQRPPRKVAKLEVHPLDWEPNEVADWLVKVSHYEPISDLVKGEQIDGQALCLMNLPTLVHLLKIPHRVAVTVAKKLYELKVQLSST